MGTLGKKFCPILGLILAIILSSPGFGLGPYEKETDFPAAIKALQQGAVNGRYVAFEALDDQDAQDVQDAYGDLGMVIIAKDQETVTRYLENQVPQKYIKPQAGPPSDGPIVLWFNSIHGDERPAPDAILALARAYATDPNPSLDATLDHSILLFNITLNPYGLKMNTRKNEKGVDLNRDLTYQTQGETQWFASQLHKWAPIALFDFHGYQPTLTIEPCSAPHYLGYEMDLLRPGLLALAAAFGDGAVASGACPTYTIPAHDLRPGFDDAATAYTSSYALLHGTLGFTVEVPAADDSSFKALVEGARGAIAYALAHRNQLIYNQNTFFARALAGQDAPTVDDYLQGPLGFFAGGRPRYWGATGYSYFPQGYVVPMGSGQKSRAAALEVLRLLERSGVNVLELIDPLVVNGRLIEGGSFVVDMHQAKRGFAQAVLGEGQGADFSPWPSVYGPTVNGFGAMRGFTVVPLWGTPVPSTAKPVDIQGYIKIASYEEILPFINGEGYIGIKNNGPQAIRAVNHLLGEGASVFLNPLGYFRLHVADLDSLLLSADLDYVYPKVGDVLRDQGPLVKGKVWVAGGEKNRLWQLLTSYGFNCVGSPAGADVVVDSQGMVTKDYKVPMVFIGRDALVNVAASGFVKSLKLDDLSISPGWREGLLVARYEEKSKAKARETNGFSAVDYAYVAGGVYFKRVPPGAEALVRVSEQVPFFLAGWWPGFAELRGRVLSLKVDNVYLIGQDLGFSGHATDQMRLLTNIILLSRVDPGLRQ